MEPKGKIYLEKRTHIRMVKELTIHYKVMPKKVSAETERGPGKSLDISLGGVKLDGVVPAETGDILRVEIFGTDPKDNVTVLAEVRWVKKIDKKYEFGVKFVGLREEEAATLEELLGK